MKIFLIGLPGSGKTTLGKELASLLKISFIDLDDEIEKNEGQSIQEIFKSKGEEYFRQIESSHLKKNAQSNLSFVMATGGGAPCFHNGIDIMNHAGKTIFIDVPEETLLKRLENSQNRPLLKGDQKTKLSDLKKQREDIYRQSKIAISGETITANDLYRKITRELY